MFNNEARAERREQERMRAERAQQDHDARIAAEAARVKAATDKIVALTSDELYRMAAKNFDWAENAFGANYGRVTALATMAIFAKMREDSMPRIQE